MSLEGMLGVFILLVISVMVGFFIMIIEWIYASARDSRKQVKVSKFALSGVYVTRWRVQAGREALQSTNFPKCLF